MQRQILFLLTLIAPSLGLSQNAFAQDRDPSLSDLIISIDGEVFVSVDQTRYFNAVNCEDPSTTTFQVRIDNAAGNRVNQVYVWVGQANANCNRGENRTDVTSNRCQPVAGGAAQTVDVNNTLNGLTLADLTDTDTEIVDCANTALQGQPYNLFVFRTPPGAVDVPPDQFGIADFYVDVTPPNPPVLRNSSPGLGESFVLEWQQPTDNIQNYLFYRSDDGNPDTATQIEGATADLNSTSMGFTASGLGLALGESTTLYVSAVDKASVIPGEGNQGDLSEGWPVTAAETIGFCDATGNCTGCSAAPIALAAGGPSSVAWALAALFALGYVRRRHR